MWFRAMTVFFHEGAKYMSTFTHIIRKRIENLSDEELIELIEVNSNSYTEEAIQIARDVANNRGGIAEMKSNIKDAVEKEAEDAIKETERKKHEKIYYVKILNQALDVGEKIARMGSLTEGSSMLRDAELVIDNEYIQLKCREYVGDVKDIGTISFQNLERIRFKKDVFTFGNQLVKPLLSGAFLGFGASVVMCFKAGERFKSHPSEYFGISLLMILMFMVLFVIFNIGKIITSSNLGIVVFEARDGKRIEAAISNDELDKLIALFSERSLPIELL